MSILNGNLCNIKSECDSLVKSLNNLQNEYEALVKEHRITLNILEDEKNLNNILNDEIKSLKQYKKSFSELNSRLLEENIYLKKEKENFISNYDDSKSIKITRLKQKNNQFFEILIKQIKIIEDYNEFIKKLQKEFFSVSSLEKIIKEEKYEKDLDEVLNNSNSVKIEKKENIFERIKYQESIKQKNFVFLSEICLKSYYYKEFENKQKELFLLSHSFLPKNLINSQNRKISENEWQSGNNTIQNLLDDLEKNEK